MNERERVYDLVYDLISEYVIQYREWMNNGVELPRLDREEVVDQIDSLYAEREKAMREALEWACNHCVLQVMVCTDCPIATVREK